MPSLFEQPQEPVELSTGAGRGTADRIGRNRKRASLRRPTTSQAAGRWWRVEHAEYMLALRITRINGDWDAYWKNLGRTAVPVANQNSPQNSQNLAANCTTLVRTLCCAGMPHSPHRAGGDSVRGDGLRLHVDPQRRNGRQRARPRRDCAPARLEAYRLQGRRGGRVDAETPDRGHSRGGRGAVDGGRVDHARRRIAVDRARARARRRLAHGRRARRRGFKRPRGKPDALSAVRGQA